MTQKNLLRAIRDKEVISFTYLNVPRVVEPYMLGLNAEGEISLCAWELSSDGDRNWRQYLIDKIRGVSPTDLYFRKPQTDWRPSDFPMKHVLAWVGAPVRNPRELFF